MQLTFLDAGQLTARLELEALADSGDGQGGRGTEWSFASVHWARIEPVSADVDELGHAERQAVTHRIWVRHIDSIRPGMRFRKASRLFSIRTVHDPDETGRYLVCRVTEE